MLVVDKTKCTGDSVCVMICPVGAISLGADGKALIDSAVCMECYSCKETCAESAISEVD